MTAFLKIVDRMLGAAFLLFGVASRFLTLDWEAGHFVGKGGHDLSGNIYFDICMFSIGLGMMLRIPWVFLFVTLAFAYLTVLSSASGLYGPSIFLPIGVYLGWRSWKIRGEFKKEKAVL
jgi:hypothetical protein